MISKTRCFLLLIILGIIAAVGLLAFGKYQANQALGDYSYEQVVAHVKKPKNIPLIEELYRLGDRVRSVKDLKSRDIPDQEQRNSRILLGKICKDSCLPIRCRMDPGLGHACRVNCPARKVKFCITSLKPLPPKPEPYPQAE